MKNRVRVPASLHREALAHSARDSTRSVRDCRIPMRFSLGDHAPQKKLAATSRSRRSAVVELLDRQSRHSDMPPNNWRWSRKAARPPPGAVGLLGTFDESVFMAYLTDPRCCLPQHEGIDGRVWVDLGLPSLRPFAFRIVESV